ncbi:MAG: hypothetical protein JXB33_04670 [Clostridia bacterium]|nr:hypothetical protein [Clostridia bacterium]
MIFTKQAVSAGFINFTTKYQFALPPIFRENYQTVAQGNCLMQLFEIRGIKKQPAWNAGCFIGYMFMGLLGE